MVAQKPFTKKSTKTIKSVTKPEATKLALTRTLVSKSLELYTSAKVFIPDFAKPIADKIEDLSDQAIVAGMNALKIEKKDVDLLIERVDNRIDEHVTPVLEETTKKGEELVKKGVELRTTVEQSVSKNVRGILSQTDAAIDFVLEADAEDVKGEAEIFLEPVSDEEEESTADGTAKMITTKYVQSRLYGMQAKVSNRFKRKALKGLTQLRLRSVELVHVDLIKYAEDFLDSETVQKTKTQLTNQVSEYYSVTQDVITTTTERVKEQMNEVVIKPAVNFYEKATALYVQLEADFRSKAKELQSSDYLKKLEETLKNDWQLKLVKPSEELFEFLSSEWASLKEESEEEKSIKLNLLVAAVQKRVTLAWSKISLALQKTTEEAVKA